MHRLQSRPAAVSLRAQPRSLRTASARAPLLTMLLATVFAACVAHSPDDWAVDVKTGDLLCTVHFQSRNNAERLPESAAPAPAARAPGAATAPVVDVL